MKSVNNKSEILKGILYGLGFGGFIGTGIKFGASWSEGFGVDWIVSLGIFSLCMGFASICGYLWNKSTINKKKPVWLKKVDTLTMFLFPLYIIVADNFIFATIIFTYVFLRSEIYPYDRFRKKGAWKNPIILYPFLSCCLIIMSTSRKVFISHPMIISLILVMYYVVVFSYFWYNKRLIKRFYGK